MAGITDAEFLNKVIPFGFDTATLGGYSLDAETIEASEKIIKNSRREVLKIIKKKWRLCYHG